MPYDALSKAPKNIRNLNGVELTLAQVNSIAGMADAMKASGEVDNPWTVAISNFKESHKVEDGNWVKRSDKSISPIITKEGDRYKIVAVSTAEIEDLEDETFTTKSMDFEIERAGKDWDYPEFRLFHIDGLGIGRVEKMQRIGIFAIDTGYSYTDKFSKAAVEKMLINNDGRWRVSRGFIPLEVAGTCPDCNEDLIIETKHMLIGFRCPSCDNVYSSYKGTLKSVRYNKTKTFDITITDSPAVPMTGVQAFPISSEDLQMTKEQLKQKLLEAGMKEEDFAEQLEKLPEKVVKSYSDEEFELPVALKALKLDDQFEIDSEEEPEPDTSGVSLEDVRAVVKEVVIEALENVDIELPDLNLEGFEVTLKEASEFKAVKDTVEELKTELAEIKELVEHLSESDETRLKELLDEAPRASKLRIRRKSQDDPELDEEEEDPYQFKEVDDGIIYGSDGKPAAESLTEFVTAR